MSDFAAKLFDLTGKIAIITGGGSGLGKAIAEGYAQVGAIVVVVDLQQGDAEKTAAAIVQQGGQAIGLKCDIAQENEVRETVLKVVEQFGRVDILLNNAGIGKRAKAEDMTELEWDMVIDINLKGTFFFSREVGRQMIAQGQGGRMINMASIAGVVGLGTGNANYAASKGGVIAMSRCLAIEWAKHNILVNVIAPSHTRTPLIEKLLQDNPATEAYFLNNIPLGRLGSMDDLVGPAIFLASAAASFVTGHTLMVDGGHTAR